jgi:hypothetical protein
MISPIALLKKSAHLFLTFLVSPPVKWKLALSESKSAIRFRFWTAIKYLLFPVLVTFLSVFSISTLSSFTTVFKPFLFIIYLPLGVIIMIYYFLLFFSFRNHSAK